MPDFYRLDVATALTELESHKDTGLSLAEVKSRTEKYGPNALPVGESTSIFKLVIEQFTDLMVIILIVAAVISFILGESTDVIVILIIVVLNAMLGVYQEYRAEQALAALRALQVPLVRVRRENEVHQISAIDLVPGDIVLLEEGDSIPADGRVLESINLRIEEAALTGESVPIDKQVHALTGTENVAVGDRTNMAFMGTVVTYGRGRLLITATALETEIGKIAGMLMGVEEGITPLQRRLNQLGKTLAIGALAVVGIVFVAGLLRGIRLEEMFLISVSLAVAAVPEGLPALVTIGLSLGASRMVKRHALIRRLPAVETLGSVTVICSDKTGTLTKNEMTATYLALPGHDYVNISGIGYTPKGEFVSETGVKVDPALDAAVGRFLKAMALSTNAHLEQQAQKDEYHVVGDTTEGALLIAAQKVGWTRTFLETTMPRVGELPFSSDRKSMTTIHDVISTEDTRLFDTPGFVSITKGAPDKLLEWATIEHFPEGRKPLTEDRRQRWHKRIEKMASEGLRVLGIAYRPLESVPEKITEDIERDLVMVGLVGIVDPARPEAREAVKVAKAAGIRSIMITGDHALTGEAIARDLGIITEQQRAITGNELDKMSDADLTKALKETSCFARVSPAHKLKIVQVLQQDSQTVAMTGDGVNDAPALKQADIGVAMGITGTDVSKGAADMVLTDDNFASIVAAVEEGRVIYDNIRKFIKYLLSSNIGEILVMFVALMAGLKVPLLAIQILWINLVTDGLPAIALGFEPAEKDVMQRKPRPVNESIFAGGMGRHITWVGTLIMILTLGGFIWAHHYHGMDPLSDTLGLEKFDRQQLVALIGDKTETDSSGAEGLLIPQNWDSLSEEELVRTINGESEAGGSSAHETSKGILGAAEHIPRTVAFSVLAFVQMFHVMAIHTGTSESFFRVFFTGNTLLGWAILSTFILQLAVIYVPFMQDAFGTSALRLEEMIISMILGSVVLFAVELEKRFVRGRHEPQYVPQPGT